MSRDNIKYLPQADMNDSSGIGRRRFLQLVGFSVGASALAGCSRGPEHGVMPYLVRPEEVTPGKPYWYASACGACSAGCGVLAKSRDGRPIKLEGNPEHPVSRGGLCAIGQASVLALYDSKRLRRPHSDGQVTDWSDVDSRISSSLSSIKDAGGKVRFLTDSVTGPSERSRIEAFVASFADGRLVCYDPISASAIAEAHSETHGARRLPRYHFERADVIVSFGADFLGTWLSPMEHTAGYRAGRQLEADAAGFSHHVQLESRMSLTGSNADRRIVVPPGSAPLLLAHLVGELSKRAGANPGWSTLPACPIDGSIISELAAQLWRAPRGRSLVLSGDNDVQSHKLANQANELLANYASTGDSGTVSLGAGHSKQKLGNDADLVELMAELERGEVDALFMRGVNPVYDLPDGAELAALLKRVKLVVSFADSLDETASQAHFVCPEPHFLESWGDAEPIDGLASIRQPAVRVIGASRPMLESLASWSGSPSKALDSLREVWRREVYPRRESDMSFEQFWNQALHDGFVQLRSQVAAEQVSFNPAAAAVSAPAAWRAPAAGEQLLELHPSATMLDGRHAHNPWLHELPDPIAKTVWDNFAALSPELAASLGVTSGNVVRIEAKSAGHKGIVLELPALVQPGQQSQTVAIALGYGRSGTDRFSDVGPQWWEGSPTVAKGQRIGANAASLLGLSQGALRYSGMRCSVAKTDRHHELATTQIHHSLKVPEHLGGHTRPIIQETTLAAWRKDPSAGGQAHHALPSLWPDHPKVPHHWGLAIDLNACTGCSACVIACQAENNIPVVGKDEVERAREMHWMRIDRYYSGEGPDVDVAHMPMLCQHCDNAPCETVCPVQATAQSSEGLNQQIYNRCVGTRYCANNCPYKVRRFNWFEYPREDRLANLALNPDVTVRSRGVMEKCSMCVQRIQDAKAEAKREGRPVQDGDILPACAQSCPAGAIVFGDMNDPNSKLTHLKHDPRHYTVLAELGVKPVVGYLTRVRNRRDG